jgi:hypothetical protein
MRRKMITLCAALLLMLTCSISVFAQDFDPLKSGSVSVTLTEQYSKAPIVGVELSIYYIAEVGINTDGNLNYIYTRPFAETGIAIDDSELTAKLDAYLTENEVAAVKVLTDSQGKAVLSDLPLGMYFIRQTNSVVGFAPCTPFLVTVPMANADGYVYEVNASPKTEVAKLTSITVKKVWNTNSAMEASDHVTVQLLRNGNVVETATLNAKNNWQITYPNMPESDAYSIQEIDIPKGFTATYSKTGYVFTVTNTSTLIQTGQLIWPIPVLAVCGMLLIALGTTLLQKKRKTNA